MDNLNTTSPVAETESLNEKIFDVLGNPLKLITNGKKYGVKGVGRFFLIAALFIFVNLILMVVAIYKLIVSSSVSGSLLYFLGVLVVGVAITVFAGFKGYAFVRTDALRVIYENLRPYIPGYCNTIIQKVLKSKVDLDSPNVKSAVDFYDIFNQYFSKLPSLIRRWLINKLHSIPFMPFLLDVKQDILSGNSEGASQKLFNKVDASITEGFRNNNTRWVLWLLPLNLIIQIILITRIL